MLEIGGHAELIYRSLPSLRDKIKDNPLRLFAHPDILDLSGIHTENPFDRFTMTIDIRHICVSEADGYCVCHGVR